ncbi:hypothetical protein A2W15_06180 [Candidatus Woesebacteria bacterium RBG_16_41_13]|nr:MAG: hypothetical protein A2W15_06180 [Candidatus Woesebacteria bacterium RBG_16_41_13]
MSNGFLASSQEYKSVKAISERVRELKSEVSALARITNKLVVGKKLSETESDTLTLLTAREEDRGRGWVSWRKFKKQLN